MAVEFSKEQLKAIEIRNKDMVLSASAGSGKTTVLVERIIRLVCEEGISLENLAVVTFTNAAAGGIREKLRKALRSKIDEKPDDEHLRKELLLLSNADISTVHSFCGKIIKKYNQNLKVALPSGTRLMNETEEAVLKQECAEEIITEYYEKDDELFEQLMESYSPGRDDSEFVSLLLKAYGFILSIPFYEKWIEGFLSGKNSDVLTESLDIYVTSVLKSAASKYALAVEEVKTGEGLEKQQDYYIAEYNMLLKALNGKTLEDKLDVISKIAFEKLPPKKKGADNTISKTIRDHVKDLIKDIQINFSNYSEDEFSIPGIVVKFFEIIKEIDSTVKERKYSSGCISFTDQEHFAIEILSDDSVSDELKKRYYEIMVDEYQDTNEIQDYIFSRISRGNNLFTVGDVKQSIYRFRHAKPSIFTQRIKNGAQNANSEVIYLNRNFRSSANVARTVNLIFSFIMNDDVSDIDYKSTDMLIPKCDEPAPDFETEVIICDDDTSDEGIPSSEAQVIAEKIEKLMHNGLFFGKDSERRLRYSDITILIRGFSNKTLDFLSQLTELGIPCKYEDKINLFDTPEIKLMTAFLKAIDNPLDDISLLAVLRNVFNLDDNDLFELRKNDKYSDFFTLLKQKRHDIYKEIRNLSAYSARYGLSALISKLYKDYLIPEKWIAMGGVRRNDNLMTLLKTAREFEANGFKSTTAFLAYVEKLISTKKKIIPPDLSDGDSDCVKVMTIHKSKGLEFPVVILAGCGNKFNTRDLNQSIILNSELGPGFNIVNPELRYRYPSLSKKIIAKRELHELLSEEMRLLYVALTRAENKLIITGTISNSEKRFAEYSAITYNSRFALSYTDFIEAGCYFDFIIPPLLFADQNKLLGTNIPTELVPAVKDSDAKIINFSAHSSESKEQEDPGEIIRRLVFSEGVKGSFRIFSYDKPEREIPKKISVTALNKLSKDSVSVSMPSGGYEIYSPEFIKDGKLSSSRHGSMLHLIFEKIDLESLAKSRNILKEIYSIIDNNAFLKENMTIDDAKKIEEFFKHPLGIKLLRSKKVFREKEFLISYPSESIYPGSGDKEIIIQGIIDCCFEDTNKDIYLIDYKFTNKNEENIRKTYKQQLELYKLALSKLMNVDISLIRTYIWDINRCVSYDI